MKGKSPDPSQAVSAASPPGYTGPYREGHANFLYNLLFCDDPSLLDNSETAACNGPPWSILLAVVPVQVLKAGPPELPPLTTESGASRLPGKFVWADLATDDIGAAQKFYGALFGWTFTSTRCSLSCRNTNESVSDKPSDM